MRSRWCRYLKLGAAYTPLLGTKLCMSVCVECSVFVKIHRVPQVQQDYETKKLVLGRARDSWNVALPLDDNSHNQRKDWTNA